MTSKDAIKSNFDLCNMILTQYVSDFTDEELMKRSTPGTNHIAWQLGHIISSCNQILVSCGLEAAPLADGVAEAYTKETATSDDPAKFHRKEQYLKWLDEQNTATLAALDAMPEADLDKPTPESMRAFRATVGDVLIMLGAHLLMHAGQFVPLRRQLNKPVLI